MKRKAACLLAVMVFGLASNSPLLAAQDMRARQAAAAAQARAEAEARAQQAAAQRAQEEAQRRAQEEAQRQAEAQQRAQEEAQRAQEEAQQRAQQEAQRQAEVQARAQQEAQMRAQQEAQQAQIRAQEEAQRQAEAQARQQQAAQRQAEAEAVREHAAAPPGPGAPRPEPQAIGRERHELWGPQRGAEPAPMQPAAVMPRNPEAAGQPVMERPVEGVPRQPDEHPGAPPVGVIQPPFRNPEGLPHEGRRGEGPVPGTAFGAHRPGEPPVKLPLRRPEVPRPLTIVPAPMHKAMALPVVQPQFSPEQQQQCQDMIQNLRTHCIPVAPEQVPTTFADIRNNWINYYTNNYPTYINNTPIFVNPGNTYFSPVPPISYPYWYQPQPGWTLSNGFTLGNMIRAGLDWLAFGWHRGYAPSPEGFICATNYVPTPWIYVPAFGMWRQAGMPGWSPVPPPPDYMGPISVEVTETRRVWMRDPFTWQRYPRWINVAYLYDAFFFPGFDRWGYMNHRGYFIWLNI